MSHVFIVLVYSCTLADQHKMYTLIDSRCCSVLFYSAGQFLLTKKNTVIQPLSCLFQGIRIRNIFSWFILKFKFIHPSPGEPAEPHVRAVVWGPAGGDPQPYSEVPRGKPGWNQCENITKSTAVNTSSAVPNCVFELSFEGFKVLSVWHVITDHKYQAGPSSVRTVQARCAVSIIYLLKSATSKC